MLSDLKIRDIYSQMQSKTWGIRKLAASVLYLICQNNIAAETRVC